MKFISTSCASLGLALLLNGLPLTAQIKAGQPDPTYSVPAALDLPYALAFALDNNFAIRQAKERIRQQDGVVLEVRSTQIPTVAAGGSLQRNDTRVGPTGEDRYWSFSVTAKQTLYSGGGVSAQVRGQQLNLDASILTLQAVINDALLEVRTRFYTVLVNRERIKVQEQNTELLQRQLQDVKNRYEAGTVSNFEVLRSEVALANAQTPLITARNDYRLAIEELRRSLGLVTAAENNLANVPEFQGTLEFTPASFDLRTALVAAREQRPDLLRLKKLAQAAEEGVTVRRAGYLPSVALFGAYDWRKAAGSNNFPGDRDGWTFGLSSAWNIFDGQATSGRVVDVDVRRAISTFQQANELAEASKKVVEQATEALRLANARYNAGTATQLDVLTSQVDLTTARLNQVQAYYSYNVAVATTRKAMGLADELRPGGELRDSAK